MNWKNLRIFRLLTCLLVLFACALGLLSSLGRFVGSPPSEMSSRESAWAPATSQAETVRLGIYVRSLGSIDAQHETFAADFDLWLVSYNLPNAADFVFPDAVGALRLGEPVELRKTSTWDYARYHVAGAFKYSSKTVDLISGRLRLAIRILDAAKPLDAVVLFPDDEGSKLLPGEEEGATTMDGAWAVTSFSLGARRVLRATLGDPDAPAPQVAHGEVVASYGLRPVSPSLYQRVQRFVPQGLALPVLVTMAGLLMALPVLARFGRWTSPWRWFAALVAAALLLASGQKAFEAYVASGMVAATIKTVLVVVTGLWLALIAAFVVALLPLVVWGPLERRSGGPASALEKAAVNTAVVAVFLLYFLANTLDLSPASIGAASGVLTIVLGIALQNIILDVFSGILLNLEKPFRLRHWVSISVGGSPISGQVRDMNWRTTQLQTRDNNIVSIPNSILAKASVKNFASPSAASRFATDFILQADTDVQKARQVLKEGALRAAEKGAVLDQPPLRVKIVGIEDYGIRFSVRYFLNLNVHTAGTANSAVMENVITALAEADIRLAFREAVPAQDLPTLERRLGAPQVDEKVVRLQAPAPKPSQTVLSVRDVEIITETWALVRPLGEQVAVLFYDRLFEIAPQLKSLFRSDSRAQRQKLLVMMATLIKSLEDTDALLEMLADLGLRHETYGVQPKDYEPVGAALLWTLETGLGEAFDAPARAAWTHLYVAASGAMTRASGRMLA